MSQVMDDVEPRFSCEILNKPQHTACLLWWGHFSYYLLHFMGIFGLMKATRLAIASQPFSAIWTYWFL